MDHGQNSHEALPQWLDLNIGFMRTLDNNKLRPVVKIIREKARRVFQMRGVYRVARCCVPRLGFRGLDRSVKRVVLWGS